MGYWKNLLITNPELAWRISEGTADGDLEEIAELLDGETSGLRWVLCPSPGRPWNDRTMRIIFNDPRRPSHFFIYAVDGPLEVAQAHVRDKLGHLPDAPPRDHSKTIRSIWEETVPATGTMVEKYLRSRGITVPPPPSLRFHPGLYHTATKSRWPGMVAARTDAEGRFVTVHRTFLQPFSAAKAPIDPVRMDIGPANGTGILLAPVAEEMVVGEGIETVLSGMQMSGIGGIACGVAINLRAVLLPAAVRHIRILVDGDEAGENAARAAAARWFREGRRVGFAYAPAGKDFNDLILREGSSNA
jgi:putative DNA primase/helicase